MTTARPFFNGIPTDLDLKKLEERFGLPEPGTLIPHADIEACLDLRWRTTRYRTVLGRWRRKLMRESNVDTIVEPGIGLKVLQPAERITASEKDFRGCVRGIGQASTRIGAVPTAGLSDTELARRDRAQQVIWRVRQHVAAEVKALQPPPPPKALPRPSV